MAASRPPAHGTVSHEMVVRVQDAVSGMRNLGHVLSWGASLTPPRKPEEIVTQDEYTHDVVMQFTDGVYAVFDVT